ncbi:monocarboxylate transporter 12-B-like [Dreissena polymorpha]|uniref:Major facilitator superfamily (MFS) profile domain-containing protein n=1 Tax=Dreissena polymorpha TaxID=45954 RepID=A0A9D4JFA1_DREPO|nr:monocarboxylate transporter 12-B-like [Dreissena polymorpha]KAH3807799.1 hypothetical protein DPMN_136147 [Dreissena polymorpha]
MKDKVIQKDDDTTVDSHDMEKDASKLNVQEPDASDVTGDQDLPIDRGWAWVVLAACTLEIMVYGGINRSFGVFFLQFQLRFNSNASETAVMNLIQNLTLSVTALFAMTIGLQRFSTRVSVCVGGILTVVGYAITAFATDIRLYYFAQGILCGAGLGMIHPQILAIIGAYFNKHRGLANSIFTSGGSVGGLAFAPIVVKLFDEYGYTGAMLIITALLIHIILSGLLMRPIEQYSRRRKKERSENKQDASLIFDDAHNHDDNVNYTSGVIADANYDLDDELDIDVERANVSKGPGSAINRLKHVEMLRMQSYDPDIASRNRQESPLIRRARAHSYNDKRSRTLSECTDQKITGEHAGINSTSTLTKVIQAIDRSEVALYASGEGIFGSFIDINSVKIHSSVDIKEPELTTEKSTTGFKKACCTTMFSGIKYVLCTVFDLSLMKNPIFLLFLLMAFCMMSGMGLVPLILPPHAKDVNLSNSQIAICVSVQAGLDLFSKITLGYIADRKWLTKPTILASVAFMVGTACHLVRFANSFEFVMVLNVFSGICVGQYVSMYAVLMIEVIGVEKFKKSLGFGALVHGTAIAIIFPVTGLLRDNSGSYVASFHLLGALAYVGAALVIVISRLTQLQQAEKQAREKDTVELAITSSNGK